MTGDVKQPPDKPNYLGLMVKDMIHRAGLTGRPASRALSGGAALLVVVQADEIRLVVSRAGQPLGDVELRTFARLCVPEGAVRWPAEDQNCVKQGAGWVWRVGWKWTREDGRMSGSEGETAGTYRLLHVKELGGIGILCLVCMRLSFNPNDLANRYCGNCHRFHDDPERSEVT